mmetsp:Transcript_8578/g.12807  ORF Transcript_8578/g.12807 Transcript_8578/m.12807 type:complete len:286 (-) Transcript_8578:281-1138(-)
MGKFEYLPEVIVMVLIEFAIVVAGLYVHSRYSPLPPDSRRWLIFEQRTFESCVTSIHGEKYTALLCGLRLLFFLWFLGIGVIYKLTRKAYRGGWEYFTNWNLVFISLYYLFAFLSSIFHIVTKYRKDDMHVSDLVKRRVSTFISIHFAVAGATALFITLVNFTLLSPRFYFFNVVSHFTTSVSFLIEMSLNNIHIHYKEFVFSFVWALLWLIIIWPSVAEGVKDWPYDFLQTDKAACFAWYNILFVVNFIFYSLWWYMSQLKFRLLGKAQNNCSVDDDNDILMNA